MALNALLKYVALNGKSLDIPAIINFRVFLQVALEVALVTPALDYTIQISPKFLKPLLTYIIYTFLANLPHQGSCYVYGVMPLLLLASFSAYLAFLKACQELYK